MPKITAADGLDLNNLPVELTGNLITVGDKTILLVNPEHSANDGGVSVTPIIFSDDEIRILAVLEKKTSSVSDLFRRGAGGLYVSEQLQWDVTGASKIGLHVTAITGTSNGIILRAGVV